MECMWCGLVMNMFEFVDEAIRRLGWDRWNIFGPTFLCPRCHRHPREPNNECDKRVRKKIDMEEYRRLKKP